MVKIKQCTLVSFKHQQNKLVYRCFSDFTIMHEVLSILIFSAYRLGLVGFILDLSASIYHDIVYA